MTRKVDRFAAVEYTETNSVRPGIGSGVGMSHALMVRDNVVLRFQ